MAVLTPIASRDYKSAKAVREAWEGNKDFLMQPSGRYCSIRDQASLLERDGWIEIRYAKNTKLIMIYA